MCAVRLKFNRWLQLSLLLTVFYRLGRDYNLLDAATTTTASAPSFMSMIVDSTGYNRDRGPAASLRASVRPSTSNRSVHWLTEDDIPDILDFFSASWYMGLDRFLETNVSEENLANVEAGCFGVFRHRSNLLRMSLDWLDFSVEHMSKWWRKLGCPDDPAAFNATVGTFSRYIEEHVHRRAPYPESSLLHPTIALIAFQQYRSDESPTNANLTSKDHAVTTTSLGATIASLVQVGMGRILVVGYEPSDEAVVRDSFRLLNANCQGASAADGDNISRGCQVHGSQLVYVRAKDDLVRSKFIPVNMPRAALAGLMTALDEYNKDSESTRRWLGEDPTRWRYVYLTEPDTILQTRPSTIPHLKRALDQGLILSPHRFQPLPHQDDAKDSGTPHLIPNDYKTPWVLNNVDDNSDACCDAQEGDHKPGRSGMDSCGDFWWLCGYGHGHGGNHSRLAGYELLRLSQGTGIVNLAGNEHGRRCIPSVGGTPCQYRAAR